MRRIAAAAGIVIALALGAFVAVGYRTAPPAGAELRPDAAIPAEFPDLLGRPLPARVWPATSVSPLYHVPPPPNAPDQRGMPHLIIVPADGGAGTLQLRPR